MYASTINHRIQGSNESCLRSKTRYDHLPNFIAIISQISGQNSKDWGRHRRICRRNPQLYKIQVHTAKCNFSKSEFICAITEAPGKLALCLHPSRRWRAKEFPGEYRHTPVSPPKKKTIWKAGSSTAWLPSWALTFSSNWGYLSSNMSRFPIGISWWWRQRRI